MRIRKWGSIDAKESAERGNSKHFVRGALYFYANPDSIALVLIFVEEDVKHLVSTFSWK